MEDTIQAPGGEESAPEVRHCRYSRCGRPLPVVTRPGRKPEYCDDRRWEDGRSCKQMAQAEQRAERAAGLDVPLTAYRAATERIAPALSELRTRLDELLTRALDVDSAALARIEDAETAMTEAIERAQAAEARATTAENQRAEALRQARDDREATTVAHRQARDAERDKEQAAEAAWRKVVDAEAAQGRAEGQATELKATLAEAARVAEAHAAKMAELQKELTGVRERLIGEIARGDAAERDRDTAQAHGEAQQTRAESLHTQLDQLREDLAAVRVRAETAEIARDQAHHDLGELGQRVDELRDQLGAARGHADATEANAARLREENSALHTQLATLTAAVATANSELEQARTELAHRAEAQKNTAPPAQPERTRR